MTRPGGYWPPVAPADLSLRGDRRDGGRCAGRAARGGVRVPEDMSLAGFDDIPLVRELSPPLTTVALPLAAMGERVIALALRTPSGPGGRGWCG